MIAAAASEGQGAMARDTSCRSLNTNYFAGLSSLHLQAQSI